MRSGDPFPLRLVRNPSSQLAPTAIGMAKLQSHQLGLPTRKTTRPNSRAPILPGCAPKTPRPLPSSLRAVKNDGNGKTRHHQPPASPHPPPQPGQVPAGRRYQTGSPSARQVCWSRRWAGERVRAASTATPAWGGQAPAIFFPVGGCWCGKEKGTAWLTGDLQRPEVYTLASPCPTVRWGTTTSLSLS